VLSAGDDFLSVGRVQFNDVTSTRHRQLLNAAHETCACRVSIIAPTHIYLRGTAGACSTAVTAGRRRVARISIKLQQQQQQQLRACKSCLESTATYHAQQQSVTRWVAAAVASVERRKHVTLVLAPRACGPLARRSPADDVTRPTRRGVRQSIAFLPTATVRPVTRLTQSLND